MQSKHPLRIVNYAVNGLGLGHLTRLCAVSRHIRRIASSAGIASEISFLTSSESDALCYAHGFASFKIPSKNSVAQTRIAPHRYRKMAKQWIWNAVNVLSPDILVVDTFPSGSFNELYDILDFGQRNVFMYRAVKAEIAEHSSFQSVLRAYHRIIVPSEHGATAPLVPDECRDRVSSVGEILIRSNNEIADRYTARRQLDIPQDATVIYCTVGGGGDANAEQLLQLFRDLAARNPDYIFVIGAGPLYRGAEVHAANIRWTQRLLMMEFFNAFDCALTAGGFNSVNELLHCGIPCLFLPQERKYDDQFLRAQQHADKGAGLLATSMEVQSLTSQLQTILGRRDEMSFNACRAVPRNHAIDAAKEILCTAVPHNIVEEAVEVLQHAALESKSLSLAEEHHYCELLAELGKLAARQLSEDVVASLSQAEERAALAEELVEFAAANNRSLKDALRAVRAMKHLPHAAHDVATQAKQFIIQPPNDYEERTLKS